MESRVMVKHIKKYHSLPELEVYDVRENVRSKVYSKWKERDYLQNNFLSQLKSASMISREGLWLISVKIQRRW